MKPRISYTLIVKEKLIIKSLKSVLSVIKMCVDLEQKKTYLTSVLSEDYSKIAMTESWLNDGIFGLKFFDSIYVLVRRDRSSGKSKS